jgi:hypothetical protein
MRKLVKSAIKRLRAMKPVTRLTTLDWSRSIPKTSQIVAGPSKAKTVAKLQWHYFQEWLIERKLPLMSPKFSAMKHFADYLEVMHEIRNAFCPDGIFNY